MIQDSQDRIIRELGRKLRGVLFDYDGVLGDTLEDNYQGWRFALSRHGKELSREEYFMLEGHTVREVAQMLSRAHQIGSEHVEQIWQDKEQYYREHASAVLFPCALPLISLLKQMGVRCGLVTAATGRRLREPQLQKLFEHLDAAVSGDDVSHGKPAPEPYLKGAEKLRLTPLECLVVENAPLGVQAAKSAGMTCIAICSSLTPQHLQAADLVLPDLVSLYDLVLGHKKVV